MEADMTNTKTGQKQLLNLVFSRVIVAIPVIFGILFIPAGTLNYWEAWVYLAVLFLPMGFVLSYLLKNSPDLLERRMKLREEKGPQKLIVSASAFVILLAFILPGFDQRYGWSQVPAWLVIAADGCVLLGYALIIWVFRTNRFASRVIEVAENQQVISSGPYALVRHPMYVGTILMYALSPLALGSYWAVLPGLLIIPTLVARILNEEQSLVKDLAGYGEYMQRVRYRLFPGIW
jgi:protein-S-isoprenylcysteine O-methyltransferase Ste14